MSLSGKEASKLLQLRPEVGAITFPSSLTAGGLETAQQVYDQGLKSLLAKDKENKKQHNHPLKFSKLKPINLLLSKVSK